MKTINQLKQLLSARKVRSAWDRGVNLYAKELLDGMEEEHGGNHELYGSQADMKDLLNGASSWQQFSEGGCSLIYDHEIAERLCSPSELKKTRGGEHNPNKNENWIDVQAIALGQAASRIRRTARQ